jgi:hypothetical protein
VRDADLQRQVSVAHFPTEKDANGVVALEEAHDAVVTWAVEAVRGLADY